MLKAGVLGRYITIAAISLIDRDVWLPPWRANRGQLPDSMLRQPIALKRST
jgi:hypothetical protein